MGAFGYFGKIPAQGDFLRRGLSPGFVEPWDHWVQSLMLGAREALGAAWQASYFSAPIWRFALAPKLCGPSAIAGVLMPSVDRVGRQFPLTLAAEIEAPSAWAAYCTAAPAFPALEDIALSMLEDDADREHLDERLGRLCPGAVRVRPAVRRADGTLCLSAPTGSLETLLAGEALASRARDTTLWAAETDGGVRALVCSGLPQDVETLCGLVDLAAPVWGDGPLAAMTGEPLP